MKISLLVVGFLTAVSIAQAKSELNGSVLTYEGRITKATGEDSGRLGQSCTISILKTGRNSADFNFGISADAKLGFSEDLNIARKSNTHEPLYDFVYMGPKVKVNPQLDRQERITLDYSKGEAKLTFAIRESDSPHEFFMRGNVSQLECVGQAKVLSSDDVSAESSASSDDEINIDSRG